MKVSNAFITYFLSMDVRKKPPFVINTFENIRVVNKSFVNQNLYKLSTSKVIDEYSFKRSEKRYMKLGMSGRAYQSSFTVACLLTHRRAWQTFVSTSYTYALILENDAVLRSKKNIPLMVHKLNKIDVEWDFLQLGRCWDFCQNQTVINSHMGLVQSESPSCSHAYIITKRGAHTLLKYSLPHITSVDLLFGLLFRQKILRLYSLTPPFFTQDRSGNANSMHDPLPLKECDWNENYWRAKLENHDSVVRKSIENHWMQYYIAKKYEPPPIIQMNESCGEYKFCYTVSGSRHTSIGRYLLHRMDEIGIKKFIMWDLIQNKDLRHIQLFVLEVFKWIFEHSRSPRKICWPKYLSSFCSWDSQNTLFFIISQELLWSGDQAIQRLKFHETNRHIFYGTPPLHLKKNYVQLFFHGEFLSVVDSLDFVHSKKFLTFFPPDYIPLSEPSLSKKTIAITYDISRKMFCDFLEKCNTTVLKYGFREYDCNKSYIFIKAFTRNIRLKSLRRAIFVPILSQGEYIPSDFFTAIVNRKKILTNNPYIKYKFPSSSIVLNDFSKCNSNEQNELMKSTTYDAELRDIIIKKYSFTAILNKTFMHFLDL